MPDMTRARSRFFGIMAALAALGGCSVYHDEVDGGYSATRLTASGSIPIQVDGTVDSIGGAPLAASVIAAMPKQVGDTPVAYSACAPHTECPGDHIVWTFGPPAARPASAYPPAAATNVGWMVDWIVGESTPPVTVKVALFQSGNVVASAEGQVDATGPDDPAFQALIADMSDTVLSEPGLIDWITP